MEQMNKKELIERFIELLGNNEILGKVMSIKQIREKLNNIVEVVTYKDEPGNFSGECLIDKNGKVIINFDTRKISYLEENVTIVHELLFNVNKKLSWVSRNKRRKLWNSFNGITLFSRRR